MGQFDVGEPAVAAQRQALPTTAALAATVGLHLWRRNALLSILAGTAVSALLASTLR